VPIHPVKKINLRVPVSVQSVIASGIVTDDDAPEGREWQRRLTRSIAGEIRRYRMLRGWTTERLALECTKEVGFPIARSTLAGMETGRRENISTSELLAISRALGVTPTALLVPVGPHVDGRGAERVADASGRVEIAPGEVIPVTDALAWIEGRAATDYASKTGIEDVRRYGKLIHDWLDLKQRASGLRARFEDLGTGDSPLAEGEIASLHEDARRFDEQADQIVRELDRLRARMHGRGETLPPAPSLLDALLTPPKTDTKGGMDNAHR
jgi:transcriptional regulator with XRE-family HTH domain